jgi:hypothetical protein
LSQALAKKPVVDADYLADVRDMPPPPDAWNTHGATKIFSATLPAVDWVCAELDLGPGRPFGIYSKAGVGKTTEVLDVCCSVATGTAAFQRFPCRRGKVAFVTYDVGFIPTATKLRQIANGRGHTLAELEGQLEILTFPNVYLNSPDAEKLFRERFRGHALVIIDCFRDSIPGIEENSSETGAFLKMLARASEATSTTFGYLHHSQKGETADPLDVGRGSSAIRGASGAIWTIDGSGRDPRLFTHSRAHDCSLGPKDPFLVEMATLASGGAFETSHPSILLTARSLQESKTDAFFAKVESNKAAGRERLDTLVRLVRNHPNACLRDLRDAVKGTILANKDTLRGTLDAAIEEGLIRGDEVSGKGGKRTVYNVIAGSL